LVNCLLIHTNAQTGNANEKEIELLLNKAHSKIITADEKKELKAFAFDIQNKGQRLDEQDHDYRQALNHIDKAIAIFSALDDTLNIANNKKFKGYLLSRFGKFSEAKAEIADAVNLFQLKNKDWGVVVSQFDLARVYEFENKIDSAVYYTDISVSFWKSKGNNSRILSSNVMLINLFIKLKQLEKARIIQKESVILATDPEMHWQGIIDLYFASMKLYKAANELNTADQYQKLYINRVSDLKKDAITARSYYDDGQ